MAGPVVCPGTIASRVTVDHVTKSYGRLTALSDVSLSIRRGEVLGLIGPNGAGKTTLFECIAGVLPSESGTIAIDGRPVSTKARSSFIFYMPDGIAPWPTEPLKWAVDFTLGFFGGTVERRAEVIAQLGLEPLLASPIGTLSKGQRKRATLAIGMLTPHPLFLVDEPFDGLDLRQTREVAAAIRAHAARGRTVFLSIHQISDARRVCDRFVLISGGRVAAEGTLEELLERARAIAPAPSYPSPPSYPSSLEEAFLALT